MLIKTAEGEEAQQLSRSKFNQVLDCILVFLQMKEQKLEILRQFDVAKLLHGLVLREQVKDDKEMLKKLEEIMRAVFFSPGVLRPSLEQFVKDLLKNQASSQLNKLGI